AKFRADSQNVYLEVYLSLFHNNLNYQHTDSEYVAAYKASVAVYGGDSLLDQQVQSRQSRLDSTELFSPPRQLLNTFTFKINPGEYRVVVRVQDLQADAFGEYDLSLRLSPFPDSTLAVSDVQLAGKLSRAQGPPDFTKNSYFIIPNPTRQYSVRLPMLYYYLEAYNMNPDSPDNMLQIKYWLTSKSDSVVKTYPLRTIRTSGSSAVITGGFNLVTLPEGPYQIHFVIRDMQNGDTAAVSNRFYFAKNPARTVTSLEPAQLNTAPYLKMNEAQLDSEFAILRYLASAEEKSIYESLDETAKKQFLVNFWKKRDPQPETPQNELKLDFKKRLQIANSQYSHLKKEGWQTDRGRILLTYGLPDEIERYTMEIDKKPHEIWRYDKLEGGVIFVFADLYGFGQYELLHSTYSREIYQPDWERLVERTRFDVTEPGGN
ncbi:MAG: GWxTD domain-containing protein, partial [Calditrichia bacterium]